jgi:hypothetical protein
MQCDSGEPRPERAALCHDETGAAIVPHGRFEVVRLAKKSLRTTEHS